MPIKDEIRRLLSFVAANPKLDLVELIGAMGRQSSALLVQTYALFSAEAREKMQLLTKDAIVILVGGSFLWIGLLTFVAASIIVLSFFIPLWLAIFFVSLFFGFVGIVLVISGIAMLRRRTIAPELTMQAIRENTRWLKEQLE